MAVIIPPDLQKVSDALAKIIRTVQQPDGSAPKIPLLPPYRLDDCGWVANRWCELLPLPLALKQRLLELDNPLVRLELVCDILERTGISM
jgi:Lon protease-like protein